MSDHETLILDTLASSGNISNLQHLALSECTEEKFAILVASYKRAPLKILHAVDALKELWITWPQLKELTVTIVAGVSFGSTSLDSIFTGIPDASLKSLNHGRMIPVPVKILPYIGALKKLTHLKIKGQGFGDFRKVNETFNAGLKITDHTARLALSNLKELVLLRISSNRYEISSSCVQDLCNALDLHQVDDGNALRLVKYQWQKYIRFW